MTVIILPWPPKALSSNGSHGHWQPKATATATYRAQALWLAKAARVERDPNARLTFDFCPPDRRRRDLHNLFGAPAKAIIDGIADAMGCDDNAFRCRFPEAFGPVVDGGQVRVIVEAAE